MSTLRVTNLKGGSAGSAPNLPDGAVITGVATVGVLSATTFYGSGANLTGIDATALKDSGGSVKIQANSTGAVVTGVLTATTGSFTGNISVGGTLTYEDVTNVDSIGIITARNGINVTGGVITGNGSGLTNLDASPKITANAAENINAGTAVIVDSNGQFAGITSTTVAKNPGTFTDADVTGTGSYQVYGGSLQGWRQLAYDRDNGIVMFTWQRQGSTNSTYCRAFKFSETGVITVGAEQTIVSQAGGVSDVCYAGQGRFAFFYRADWSSDYAQCCVLTVDTGTLVTTVHGQDYVSGSAFQITNAAVRVVWNEVNNKILFIFRESSWYRAQSATMNYAGNGFSSWSSRYDLTDTSSTSSIETKAAKSVVYDPDSEKVIFCYNYQGSPAQGLAAIAINVANDGVITKGTQVLIGGANENPQGNANVDYDTLRNTLIFSWRYSGNILCRSATVSGTTITPVGSTVTAGPSSTDHVTHTCSGNGLFALFYRDTNSSSNMALQVGTIAANSSFTFGSETAHLVYASGEVEPCNSTYDATAKRAVVNYYMGDGSTRITSASISSVDSTSTAYVGIANTTVTTGQSLDVRTFGGTNAYQTGLSTGSTYYVQSNGSFSTTADVPSVIGGVALNSTTMLVKS